MRERFTYKGDSLWWFTEIYLHKVRRLEEAVATIIALDSAREQFQPDRLLVEADTLEALAAAEAFGRARGVPMAATGRPAERRARLSSYREAVSAGWSRLRPAQPWTAPPPKVAAFVHTAFWRRSSTGDGSGEESYIGPVLDRLKQSVGPGGLTCVGVGPPLNFRARRWWDPFALSASRPSSVTPVEQFSRGVALHGSNALWKERSDLARALTAGVEIRAAAIVRGCDLWPVLESELAHVAELQWPWSARVMDEAGAALDVLSPKVVVTYAEAGGWGRAIVLEARRRGIPSVGIQHGFIYKHWLNYLHEPDEVAPLNGDRGFPAPDRTLLFDAYASEHLQNSGHLPAERLVVTGSARLDDLESRVEHFRRAGRNEPRLKSDVARATKLVVLAAKFSEIRGELPRLFAAIGAQPAIRLVIKTHPAEMSTPYETLASGIPNISIAPADADLARLLASADALVTMNSTVAVDSLVLGLPALVLGWPTNLTPFVEAGTMMGGPDLDVADALERLLFDQPLRDELRRRATTFARMYQMQADGNAAERASNEILATIK
jgi:UDP-N-acetylglucosamine 2-epimerase